MDFSANHAIACNPESCDAEDSLQPGSLEDSEDTVGGSKEIPIPNNTNCG